MEGETTPKQAFILKKEKKTKIRTVSGHYKGTLCPERDRSSHSILRGNSKVMEKAEKV